MYEYESIRRVVYEDAWFVPVCPRCRRFVKADDRCKFLRFMGTDGAEPLLGDPGVPQPNAECRKCGRVTMPFEGFLGEPEVKDELD